MNLVLEIPKYSFKNQLNAIKIDNLKSNEDYELNIKIHSQAGEHTEKIIFRTMNYELNNQHIFIFICIASFFFTFVFIMMVIKFSRRYFKNHG